MDKLVKRITAVTAGDGATHATVIYRDGGKKQEKHTRWLSPLEKGARKLLEAEQVGGCEALRLHNKSNRKRRDGWLVDGATNAIKANRRAYNVARKALPYGLLPKV